MSGFYRFPESDDDAGRYSTSGVIKLPNVLQPLSALSASVPPVTYWRQLSVLLVLWLPGLIGDGR